MKHRLPYFLIPFTFLAAPAFGSDTSLSCADKSIVASAVRTPEDVQAFVQCAYEFVQEVGFEEARRAFNEDARWRSGPIYVFVDELPAMSNMSRAFVYPPNPSREGTPWGLLIDVYGNDIFRDFTRIVGSFEQGWIYSSFKNPATGRNEPKASYAKSIDWEGNPAAIGAGIYHRDLPGTCWGEEVNATELEDHPSSQRLQEFVHCAAMELETAGYFGLVSLSTDPRWRSHSIYLFGVDMYGNTLFTSNPYNWGMGISPSELTTIAARDDVAVAEVFGEIFLYYTSVNPSNGMPQRKASFVKRVVAFGVPILIGAGYYLDNAGQGGSATLLYWQAPTILNPYLSSGTKDAEAASLVIEPLAEYTENGEIVAVLATRVPTLENGGISADRTRITWNIREDVVWSDGTPLTANDVVFTWQYCTAPGGGCAQASSFENVASVDAADERTVTITFDGPTSFPYAPFVSHLSPILQASQLSGCLGGGGGRMYRCEPRAHWHGSIRRFRFPRQRHHPLPVQPALPRRRGRSSVFQ